LAFLLSCISRYVIMQPCGLFRAVMDPAGDFYVSDFKEKFLENPTNHKLIVASRNQYIQSAKVLQRVTINIKGFEHAKNKYKYVSPIDPPLISYPELSRHTNVCNRHSKTYPIIVYFAMS